jgi:hypothetical protein
MKTVFEQSTRCELIDRVNSLTENSNRLWGKMNVYQMLKHCAIAEESYLGKKPYKRIFIGRLIGRKVLNDILKDDRPMMRNAKTIKGFIVMDNGDIETAKKQWIALINEYETYPDAGIVHWFFGPMTKEQVGYFSYKHADHHLRQFNG